MICGAKELNITNLLPDAIENHDPYETGCVDSFGAFIQSHAVTLGGAGIAIAMIQVNISMVF